MAHRNAEGWHACLTWMDHVHVLADITDATKHLPPADPLFRRHTPAQGRADASASWRPTAARVITAAIEATAGPRGPRFPTPPRSR